MTRKPLSVVDTKTALEQWIDEITEEMRVSGTAVTRVRVIDGEIVQEFIPFSKFFVTPEEAP